MSNILEKSLDDIISESKPTHSKSRIPRNRRRPGHTSPPPYKRHPTGTRIHKHRSPPYRPISRSINSTLPRDIAALAGPRPVLRVKNIHPELNGEDLSKLFGNISPVDFVKFDAVNDSVAYVCFHSDCVMSNAEAIQRYDGKKAMGKILVVENAVSLADRITSLPVRETRGSDRGGSRGGKHRKPRRFGKRFGASAEELDKELSDYMNTDTNEDVREGSVADEITME